MYDFDNLPEKLIAIEIEDRETWRMLCAIQPTLKELSETDNIGRFLVVSGEKPWQGCIMSPETVAARFDHIEPNAARIKTVSIHR